MARESCKSWRVLRGLSHCASKERKRKNPENELTIIRLLRYIRPVVAKRKSISYLPDLCQRSKLALALQRRTSDGEAPWLISQ